MPKAQLPLLSDIGIWKDGDMVGTSPNFPYFLNGYFEKTDSQIESHKFAFVKRPGVQTVQTGFTAGHYIFSMAETPAALGSNIVIYTTDGSSAATVWYYQTIGNVLTNKGTPPAASGHWAYGNTAPRFTQLDGVAYGANNYMAATDLVKGAIIDFLGNWTEITDADFTGIGKTTNIEALDGYLFIGDNRNRIYNSDLGNPLSWTALGFISANDYPGYMVALKKVRNYLVVFKNRSIEFFEDVGNPAPGSPLESRKQLNRSIGCMSYNSIQDTSNSIIFAGVTSNNIRKIYRLDKMTLQISEVSNRFIEQCLAVAPSDIYNFVDPVYINTDQTNHVYIGSPSGIGMSQIIRVNGKEFYMIILRDPTAPALTTSKLLGYVFDIDLNAWTAWSSSTQTSGVNDGWGFVPFCGCFLSYWDSISGFTETVTFFANNVNVATLAGTAQLQIMRSSTPQWQDVSGKNYNFLWVSEPIDFGTNKRKFQDIFELIYDCKSSGAPNPAGTGTITLQYRNYDYNTTSGYAVTRTIPIDTNQGVRAKATRLGNFRRRSYTVTYDGNTPLRIWVIEITYNEGEEDQDS